MRIFFRLSQAALLLAMLPLGAGASTTQVNVPTARIVISGSVPDESTKAALITRLQELYGPNQIIDQVTVGGVVAPPHWNSHVPKLLTQNLKSISKGQLVVEGNNVALRGEVQSEKIKQAISNDIDGVLGSTYAVKNGLRVTANSQAVLDQTLANRVVEFEPGSALLTESGKLILEEIATALKRISAKHVEVIGHTDNIGQPARNLALSKSRADSVKIYLVTKGISSESISTIGMGADQPVVSNATEDGRQRNRRIEFRVSQ